jgi:dephospho-CoA kinase
MAVASATKPLQGETSRRFGTRKPVVGLVGGIGSGKSTVAEEFRRRGGHLIAADPLGHAALREPAIRAAVVRRWGPEVLGADGEIDRKALAGVVFSDAASRKELEALVFPWIEDRVREEVHAADADPSVRFLLLDAAVMLEAGWNNACDWLVYVHVPRTVRLERLAARRGWSESELEARERAQMPLTEKAARADFQIDNSGPPEALGPQVDHVVGLLLAAPVPVSTRR